MTYVDIVGAIGVWLTLFAYFLNTIGSFRKDKKLFYVLNIFGAGIACYAAILIPYWPFVALEGIWTIISIYGLMKAMKINMT